MTQLKRKYLSIDEIQKEYLPVSKKRIRCLVKKYLQFIVNALLQGYGTLNDLGRKTRAKIELLMQNYVEKIDITPAVYAKVQEKLSCYMHGNTDG